VSQGIAISTVWNRDLSMSSALRKVLGVSLFVCLTALGAFVRIPLPWTPVPVTLQSFFVLLSGLVLGGTLGVVSEVAYLAIGALGFPLFAGAAGGPAVLAGPTGGYLMAFPIAAWFVGRIGHGENAAWLRTLVALIAGILVVYLIGVFQLTIVLHSNWLKGIQLGALPFLPGDALKITAALGIYQGLRSRMVRLFR
jgi:biotin transport system substrate-specific component